MTALIKGKKERRPGPINGLEPFIQDTKPHTPHHPFKNDGLPWGHHDWTAFESGLLMLNGGGQIGQQGDLTGPFNGGR
jgi:hypothetical protein